MLPAGCDLRSPCGPRAPCLLQFTLLLARGLTTYWRLPAYNVLRFIVTLVLGE